jgi:hypothetical protein
MEPDGSFRSSEEPTFGPYPEPDKSGPHLLILSILIVFSPIYTCVFQAVSPLQVFQPKFCMHFSYLSCALRTLPL